VPTSAKMGKGSTAATALFGGAGFPQNINAQRQIMTLLVAGIGRHVGLNRMRDGRSLSLSGAAACSTPPPPPLLHPLNRSALSGRVPACWATWACR
jgi:hypothetical protein